MYKRRQVLAAAGTTSVLAGCVSSVVPSCDASLTEVDAEIVHWCDTGDALKIEASAPIGDCAGTLSLEVVANDDVITTVDEPDREPTLRVSAPAGGLNPGETLTLRIVDIVGTVVTERSVTPSHYAAAPPELEIETFRLDRETNTTSVSEPVDIDVTVENSGGRTPFTIDVFADDELVGSETGSISSGPCGGSLRDVSLAHTFYEPGEYELSARVEPHVDGSDGDETSLGTVTVRKR